MREYIVYYPGYFIIVILVTKLNSGGVKIIMQNCLKTTIKVLFLFGLLGVLAASNSAANPEQLPSGITVHSGLSYSEEVPDLTLQLFLPKQAEEPVPCVIVIQGGGFSASAGNRLLSTAIYLAEHGFAAAMIAYRGRPEHQCFDTVADTKTAVRFIRKISAEYPIDPDRIGAVGRSAGATLTALLAVTGGMDTFEGKGGHAEFSSNIQAGVAFAGVFDFVARFTDSQHIELQDRIENIIQRNEEWIGTPFSPESELWKTFSAINHIDPYDAPILFVHCKNDATVPWLQSQSMYEKMRGVGIEAAITYYETGGHGFQLDDPNQPLSEMVEFFKVHLASTD